MKPNWPLLAVIRFVLAMIVFNEHSRLIGGSNAIAGPLAGTVVAAFFIISGFSMAHSLSRNPKVGEFYERRFYRIWPLYVLALLLALVPVLRGEGIYEYPNGFIIEMPTRLQLILNALLLHPLVVGPVGANFVTWSLGVEAAFYVVAPFYTRLSDKWRGLAFGLSLAVGIMAALRGVILPAKGSFWPYIGMFWLFAMGVEVFCHRDRPFLREGAFAAVIAGGQANIAMAVALLLVLHQERVQMAPKWQRLCLYLGELSYPIYILHDPVMAIVNQAAPKTPIWAYYAATFVVSALAYHLLDAPIRGWQRRRSMKLARQSAPVEVVSA